MSIILLLFLVIRASWWMVYVYLSCLIQELLKKNNNNSCNWRENIFLFVDFLRAWPVTGNGNRVVLSIPESISPSGSWAENHRNSYCSSGSAFANGSSVYGAASGKFVRLGRQIEFSFELLLSEMRQQLLATSLTKPAH